MSTNCWKAKAAFLWGGGSKGAHEGDPVRVRVRLDVSSQIPTRHPLRHNLEGTECYTYKRDNVDMFQLFPHHGLLVQHLLKPLEDSEQ